MSIGQGLSQSPAPSFQPRRPLTGLVKLAKYWAPPAVRKDEIGPKLSRFYAERLDYHAMTARPDKVEHPQVRPLLSLVSKDDSVVEFGCGGGVVLAAIGERVREAVGFDIGPAPVESANARTGKHRAYVADVASVPLPDNHADAAYSLEVLEHVWDPAAVIREMIRVVKPGGLIFFSTPNGYAMNLHLRLRPAARAINHAGALAALTLASRREQPFENIPPDLEASPVYPDCDMITRIHPARLPQFARRCGCKVERLETYFFQRENAATTEDLARYTRLEGHPFYRWHGDHILFVGRKALRRTDKYNAPE